MDFSANAKTWYGGTRAREVRMEPPPGEMMLVLSESRALTPGEQ